MPLIGMGIGITIMVVCGTAFVYEFIKAMTM